MSRRKTFRLFRFVAFEKSKICKKKNDCDDVIILLTTSITMSRVKSDERE